MKAALFWRISPMLVLLVLSCVPVDVKFPNRVTIERLGQSEDPAADEVGFYSWREGTHTATSRPPKTPTFSCCEKDFRTDKQSKLRVAHTQINVNGQVVSQLEVSLRVRLRVRCDQMAAPAEGDTAPLADCLLTYKEIRATGPTFTVNPGGAPIDPVTQRTWWNSKTEKCEGDEKVTTIQVVYIAQYASRGVPRAVGGVPSRLTLTFVAKDGEGADKTIQIDFEQLNLDRDITAEFVR